MLTILFPLHTFVSSSKNSAILPRRYLLTPEKGSTNSEAHVWTSLSYPFDFSAQCGKAVYKIRDMSSSSAAPVSLVDFLSTPDYLLINLLLVPQASSARIKLQG